MTEVIERNGRLLTIDEFEQEIRAKTIDEVYAIALNETHDTLLEWLQNQLLD